MASNRQPFNPRNRDQSNEKPAPGCYNFPMFRLNTISLLRIALLLLIGGSANAQTWWDCQWDNRFPAVIATSGGPPLSDYQVRLDINASNVPAAFDWTRQGEDVRIVDQDDATELDFFVETWDVAGESAILWVTVPVIPGGGRSS